LRVVLEDEEGGTAVFPVARHRSDDGAVVVRLPVERLSAGVWRGALRLGQWAVPLPVLPAGLAPAKWRRGGLPWYAKPFPAQDSFALQVARTKLLKAVAGRLR
jgi:poly(ribitol-phosphate) beta-N-acetylglucosaminyltransferase